MFSQIPRSGLTSFCRTTVDDNIKVRCNNNSGWGKMPHGGGMKYWGLRATFLSRYTKD
jgi:hypothetical protein